VHLTLRQLNYFVGIVDAGNMTRAAGALRVAPTALSLQVRAMEERLEVRLLQRHSRGVRPTEAGAELCRKARQILALVDETEREVSTAHGRAHRDLRVGAPPSALRPVGIEALIEGARSRGHPGLQIVTGFSDTLTEQLLDGALDFALVCDTPRNDALRRIDLIEESLVFVTCPAEAHAGGRVTLSEALDSGLVFPGERGACWRLVDAEARKEGLALNARQMVGSVDVARHLVTRGTATAILPFGAVATECRAGQLAAHDIVDHALYRRTSLAWLPDSPDAAEAGDFVDLVIDTVSDLHDETPGHSRLLPHADAHPPVPRLGPATALMALLWSGPDPAAFLFGGLPGLL
jgi:LysR family nitrogen assimilation transcriptional regulator